MSNIDKYKNSINKIEIDENMVKSAMEKAREYKKRSDINMEKKRKISGLGKTIITVATLLSVSVASYASYVAITGNTIFKKSNVQLEGEEFEIDTVQLDGVENNGIRYKIEIPDGVVTEKDGESDIYKVVFDEDSGMELPDVYMKVTVINTNQIEEKTNEIIKEMKKYFEYDYETVEYYTQDKKVGINGYDAKLYHIHKGFSWNSELIDVYVIKINDKKAMIIENVYFMEATEGWGSIFNQLIVNTLEILDDDVNSLNNKNMTGNNSIIEESKSGNNNEINLPDDNASTGNEGMKNKYEDLELPDNDASTGNEGMKNKYEDVGILTINECKLVNDISGYATNYNYAIVDVMDKKANLYYCRLGIDDEEEIILKSVQVDLSDADLEQFYNYYSKIVDNKFKHTYDAIETFQHTEWDITSNNIKDVYYYMFNGESLGNDDYVIVGEKSDVEWLHSFFDKLR